MTIKHHSCIEVICDGCKDPYTDHEDNKIHFSDVEDFTSAMADLEGDPESQWRAEGEKHYCPICTCERETSHALTEEVGGSLYCRCGSKWARDGKAGGAP